MQKKALLFITVAMFCLSFSHMSYAEEKSMEIPIDDKYNGEDVTFRISCDGDQKLTSLYKYTLYSPSSTEYTAILQDDGAAYASIDDVSSGTWTVVVNNDDAVTAYKAQKYKDGQQVNESTPAVGDIQPSESFAEESETADEDSSGSSADSSDDIPPIGKITTEVLLNNEKTVSVSESSDDEITISQKISGLKLYFKDDSLVTEWSDANVDSANVRIFNTSTLEVYASETVSDRYLETPIPEGVKQITVSITPSTLTNIQGMEELYTIPFVNSPDAVVTYPDLQYTNQPTIAANVVLNKTYTVETYVNDSQVGINKDLAPGTHEISVPLKEGENDISIYIVDEKGNMRSTKDVVFLDTKPPVLLVETNYDGTQTYNESISFSGKAEDYDKLTFNNKTEITPAYDGTFTVEATLVEGENKFLIKAEDNAGNVSQYTAVVTRLIKKTPKYDIKMIISCAVSGAALLFLLIQKLLRKKRNKLPEDPDFVEPDTKKKQNIKKEVHKKPAKKKHTPAKTHSIISSLVFIFTPAILIALASYYVFSFTMVMSSSMAPTIKSGSICIANDLAYLKRNPERGDVVMLHRTGDSRIYLKRIVGMPGDHVEFHNGYVYINDARCIESYIEDDVETNSMNTFDVPDGSYLVLGDNREYSVDSRFWPEPYVSRNQLIGRVITVIPLG